jgi:small subunit ribosomal protein S15
LGVRSAGADRAWAPSSEQRNGRRDKARTPRTHTRQNKAERAKMTVTKARKRELVEDYGRNGTDTGSPEVQISILTTRIAEMTKHLQLHSKDYASRRGLLGMVSRRRRLLDYVKLTNPQLYLDLLQRLEIRK